MPKMEFKSSNKVQQQEQFPKLKLKNGENKRILAIEEPVVNYVHTIRAPKITNGKASTEIKTRKDNSQYETFQLEYISNPICLGDFNILQERGVDPKNCPACAAAIEPDGGLDRPKRRFAMHVVVYKTKPDGRTLSSPFQCEVVVWGFTDQVFNKLTDFADIQGDLRDHDLYLGPCTDETFQKYEIVAGPTAAWKDDAARKSLVQETYNENQAADLDVFCGRKASREWVEADVQKALKQWAIANGTAVPNKLDLAAGNAQLATGLESLLGEEPAAAKPSASGKKASEVMDFDALVEGLG